MAFLNPSNQLIQIDQGTALKYIWNPSQSPIAVYANLGEIQVPGQRYFGISGATAANPYGAPAIYVLCQYLSTSLINTGQLQAAAAPGAVYWTDTTFTTVSGILSEGLNGGSTGQMAAGYMMVNTVSHPGLTAAQILGAYVLVQVAGYLPGAYGPTATAGTGDWILGAAGTFQTSGSASAPATRPFGVQLSAVSSGLCNVLVTADII